jgi:hypothetical protein
MKRGDFVITRNSSGGFLENPNVSLNDPHALSVNGAMSENMRTIFRILKITLKIS